MTYRLLLLIVSITFSATAMCQSGSNTPSQFDVAFSPYPNSVYVQEARITADAIDKIDSVGFIVKSKPGSLSADIHVRYKQKYLHDKGLDGSSKFINLPIFGLYADYENVVTIEVKYKNGTELSGQYVLQTQPSDLDSPLPTITQNIEIDQSPIDFMIIRTAPNAAIIIDADGETRWAVPKLDEKSMAMYYNGREFIVGSATSPSMYQIGWDGVISTSEISDARYSLSHHMLEKGKLGFFNTVSYIDGDDDKPQSVMAEMTSTGDVIDAWDFDEILKKEILLHGEDPSFLVKNGVDWFHMNSVIYDSSDDSIIASSRENFVIKIDYKTKKIKWILGNPNKDWFTNFPNSLQPLALHVTGNPPIGQHTLSVSKDGRSLTLFNNGWGNQNLPDVGDSRDHSIVSIYKINAQLKTATEVWSFDNEGKYYSPICSSAYRTSKGNLLITYSGDDSVLGKFPDASYPPKDDSNDVSHVLVVNKNKDVLYDITIPRRENDFAACYTASIAYPINLEALIIR